MYRFVLAFFALALGIAAIVYGVILGSSSHQVTYKKIGPAVVAHYLSGEKPGTGYLQLVNGPILYSVNETDFTPIINGINTLADGDHVSLVYESTNPTAINVQSNFGTHLKGNAYIVDQLVIDDNGLTNVYTTQAYTQYPKGYYKNSWFMGGALIALGVLLGGSSFFFIRRKPQAKLSAEATMTDQTAEELAISTGEIQRVQQPAASFSATTAEQDVDQFTDFSKVFPPPPGASGIGQFKLPAGNGQTASQFKLPTSPTTQSTSSQFKLPPLSSTAQNSTGQFKLPPNPAPAEQRTGQFKLPPGSSLPGQGTGQFKLPPSGSSPQFPPSQNSEQKEQDKTD